MSSLFCFRGEIPHGSSRFECLYIYLACAQASHAIDTALTEALGQSRISPDIVAFLTPETQYADIDVVLGEDLLEERFAQMKRAKGIALCTFNRDGDGSNIKWRRQTPSVTTLSPSELVSNAI